MDFKIDQTEIPELTRLLQGLPGIFTRARKSALKSTGYMVQQTLRDYVEGGGKGWEALHAFTMKFRKKRGKGSRWFGRRRRADETALNWLGKFSRYRVDREGTLVQIDFGKSRRGAPGTFDPALVRIVKRAESGEKIRVTDKMRRFLAATRRKRPKRPTPGTHYFPLKKGTHTLTIPPRPIFGPVWRAVKPRIAPRFEEKFWRAVERYQEGQ